MSSMLVAAIDFGTTYSGWAFSFKHDFDKDPTKVSAKNWIGDQLVSAKAPTCVLIKPDGKTLHSFGYAAETKYANLAEEGTHKRWYYFRRFKMMLYDKMTNSKKLAVRMQLGKELHGKGRFFIRHLAVSIIKSIHIKTVFSLAIKFLKQDLLEDCHKQLADVLTEDDIKWVLTVPAIWNDGAKQFMREAAEQAGIPGSKLKIALEPEAASLYCRYLPVQKGHEQNSLASFEPGTKYIVLDAGGGTIDITVHQVIVDGKLRELHKASGGAWGGSMVDKAYERFLSDIAGIYDFLRMQIIHKSVGLHLLIIKNEANLAKDDALILRFALLEWPKTFQQFKKEHMDDYIDLLRTFEVKKREISPGQSDRVTFRIPPSLADTIKDAGLSIMDKIMSSPFRGNISYVSGKLRVDAEIVLSFFAKSVDSIVQHLASLLRERINRGCTAIVMVGGFSESIILQDAVNCAFGRRYNVIIPHGAGLAVLKGAVIFGHRPSTISERICKYTYGQSVSHKTTSACDHPPTRTIFFKKHITIGQTVKLEEEQMEMITYPTYADQTIIGREIYASKSPDPCLVTEPGCIKIGHFEIPIPDTSLGTDREIGTRFIFGDTEIAVKTEDKQTGQVQIHSIDFLE
ncbi:heat shock 70 kDa protein 12A-like [Ruditapes philippinarum]|uniref:heat shock 70 kDa protein 12A-like n=1 Tax=Ruditapes philippinarum TaxID=129788 RepID=UPI00295BC5A2|nr:heat shock 70 kDa protein 12A-like [Ruditapes philippinarum]